MFILLFLLPLVSATQCPVNTVLSEDHNECTCYDRFRTYPSGTICIDHTRPLSEINGAFIGPEELCPISKTEPVSVDLIRNTGCYCLDTTVGNKRLRGGDLNTDGKVSYNQKWYTEYCDEFGYFLADEHGEFTGTEFPIIFTHKSQLRAIFTECNAYSDSSVTDCRPNWMRYQNGSSYLWDTSRVTDMSYLFMTSYCNDLPEEDINQACASMYGRLNVNISHFDVSQVTNMQGAFYGNIGFEQDLGNWDFSAVTNMKYFGQGSSIKNLIFNANNPNKLDENICSVIPFSWDHYCIVTGAGQCSTVCSTGTQWDGEKCVGTGSLCSTGTQWDGEKCVPACVSGTIWDGQSCVSACGSGTEWNGQNCVPACTSGTEWNGQQCVSVCGEDTGWDGTHCVSTLQQEIVVPMQDLLDAYRGNCA